VSHRTLLVRTEIGRSLTNGSPKYTLMGSQKLDDTVFLRYTFDVVCEILREAVKEGCDVELRVTGRFLGEVREVGLDLVDTQLELFLDFREPLGRKEHQ
jgi:hypothetical protein